MKVYIKLKSVGKKRPALENTHFDLSDDISCLRELIESVVRQEVEKYNSRGVENMLVPFLTENEIEEKKTIGKVGFGRLYSDRKADPDEAVKAAIQGFEDGLFRVVVGEGEAADLDAPLELSEGDELTFIRLVFLAGRLW